MAYAIVTGASGGIGLCMARELASRKFDLLLIARSKDKLAEACQSMRNNFGVQAHYLALDLADKNAVNEIIHWIDQNQATVGVLINNAGYGLWGPVEKVDLTKLNNMLSLNIGTLVDLTHKMIPFLAKSKPSFLMNVASTAAYQAVPTLTTYAASKAFVVAFTRGLRFELKGSGISVSCLSPGATSTGFVDRAGLQSIKERAERVSMKPEAVAKIAIRKMFQGKAEIIPGWMNRLSVELTYFFPKGLVERIAASLYKE